MKSPQSQVMGILQPAAVESLLQKLRESGYDLVGPTLRDETIVYDFVTGSADLPVGWTDRQDAAEYRLERRKDHAWFGYVVGPHSWKRFVYPPRHSLVAVRRNGSSLTATIDDTPPKKLAFVGCRPCDIHALDRLDGVLAQGEFADRGYCRRRSDNFVIAVNCTKPGGTCFCASMGTGPSADHGFDLCLTELIDRKQHLFAVAVGSELGKKYLDTVDWQQASEPQQELVAQLISKAASQMGRSLDTDGLKDCLQANAENRHWQAVANRCLTCGNCTLVCPTCFCSTVEDSTSLDGSEAERTRRWDSCFTLDFSYVHGGSVRTDPAARYRHWITHKLANWYDQFGACGCVGCGRCITWCPVGIDITEEARAVCAAGSGDRSHAVTKE